MDNQISTSYNEIFTFIVNNENYGIKTHFIDSVEENIKKTTIPRTSGYIHQMITFRDDVIPVVNLGEFLFHTKNENDNAKLLVICNINNTKIAFEIDNTNAIIRLEHNQLFKNDNVLNTKDNVISDFIKLDSGKILGVLNLEKIMSMIG